jgi:RNA polymerase sigma-70 factor, ECF subfamily
VPDSPELGAALDAARAAWPSLALDPDRFVACLRRLLAGHPAPAELLARLHVADLYLACACGAGDRAALAVLEERMWPEIDSVLARLSLPAARRDDLMQDLRVALLVGKSGSPGKIDQYRGEGELRRWLRAAALRAVYQAARRTRREVALDDTSLAALAGIDDGPELTHVKEVYRAEFKAAFAAALAGIDRRERILLRQHYLDGLTVDELGSVHGVHRATAARWVARARARLLRAVLRELRRRLRLGRSELDSILRLVRSRIDLSLERALRATTDA